MSPVGSDQVNLGSECLRRSFERLQSHGATNLGRGDRTSLLQLLAKGLLPDALISRTSKASFTVAYMGRPTREFAKRWDGEGIDADLVDPDTLRSMWLSDKPPAPTSALLQAAWIAAEAGDSTENASGTRE